MSSNLPPNLTTHHPLTHNPLTTYDDTGLVAPGVPQFIVTETFIKITTEDNEPLVTEA